MAYHSLLVKSETQASALPPAPKKLVLPADAFFMRTSNNSLDKSKTLVIHLDTIMTDEPQNRHVSLKGGDVMIAS